MATFDINLNVTIRVNTPLSTDQHERNIRYIMDDMGETGTPVSQERFWRRFVRFNAPKFMYMLTSRRDIRANEVTVTRVP